MIHQIKGLEITYGPSKLDLILSLFDTGMGMRTVKFHINGLIKDVSQFYDVQVISARRQDSGATFWKIEGVIEVQNNKERVLIEYSSIFREGKVRIVGSSQAHSDADKATTLMEIMYRIIGMYRDSHGGVLNEEIFKLFEEAKQVHWEKTHVSTT